MNYPVIWLTLFFQQSIPSLTIVEGEVTGMGLRTYNGTQWLLVDGKQRVMAEGEDIVELEIEYGDHVKLMCTTRCWIVELRNERLPIR